MGQLWRLTVLHVICVWEGVFIDVVWYGFDSIEEVIHGGSEESKGALKVVLTKSKSRLGVHAQ